MADYQLRARIPQNTADNLFDVIKDLQEKTEVADVTTSSVTRAALDMFIKDYQEKKGRKSLAFVIDNDLNNEELNRFMSEIQQLEEKALKNDQGGLCSAYAVMTTVILEELLQRKQEEIAAQKEFEQDMKNGLLTPMKSESEMTEAEKEAFHKAEIEAGEKYNKKYFKKGDKR